MSGEAKGGPATVLTLGDWRAVKLNDHCWRLQKRAGKDAKTEWNDVDYYPTTVSQAAGALWERAARDMGGEFDLGEPTALLEALAGLKEAFTAEAVRKARAAEGGARWA